MFGRLLTAMVTPFDSDLRVDYEKAEALAEHLVESGSEGIVVGGTTGESPSLSVEEKVELARVVARAVGKRAAVLAGTGSNCTRSSVELTRRVEGTGVHGVMLVTPYYNKPSQEGLYQHFKAVAASTDLPVMLYNVPGRTSVNMLPSTVLRLAEIDNIVALKEASGSIDQATEIISKAPQSFAVYSGDDSLTLPMMAVGARGVVSVASHVAGPLLKRMIEAFVCGDVATAMRIHLQLFPLFKALFITTNPVPVKSALQMVGLDCGGVRQPLWPMDSREEESLRMCMKSVGLTT